MGQVESQGKRALLQNFRLVREEEAGGEAEAPLGHGARRRERSTPKTQLVFLLNFNMFIFFDKDS